MIAALALVALLQHESADRLVEKLGGSIEERDAAQSELARRGRDGMRALEEAARRGPTPEARRRAHAALESIAGGRALLSLDQVRAARVTLPKAKRSLAALLDELKRATKLPIELEDAKGGEVEVPDGEYRDAPLDVVLAAAARHVGGYWFVAGDRVLFAAPGPLALRVFDVLDLTYGTTDDPALSMGTRPAEPEAIDAVQRVTGDDLAHLLKLESKDDWEEADGKSLCFNNGLIIARHTPAMLARLGSMLDAWRRKLLVRVRLELEAYAVEAGAAKDADAARKDGKLVALFDRTATDKRRAALASVARVVLATEVDKDGRPRTFDAETGVKVNVRASLNEDRTEARVEVEAAFIRLLSAERRRVGDHEVHVPVFAEHVRRTTERVPTGRRVVLGRLGATKIEDGRPDIVVVGRLTIIEGK